MYVHSYLSIYRERERWSALSMHDEIRGIHYICMCTTCVRGRGGGGGGVLLSLVSKEWSHTQMNTEEKYNNKEELEPEIHRILKYQVHVSFNWVYKQASAKKSLS